MSNSRASGKNALTHGFYSPDDVVLDCEDKQEFADLRRAILDEYGPCPGSEEIKVSELARLFWQKRRVEAGSREALNKRRALKEATASGNGLDIIADDIRAAAKSQSEAAQIVCNRIVKHVERVFNDKDVTADNVTREFEKLTELAKELNILGKELVVPMLHAAEKWKLDEIEGAYDPDIIERELKIQAEIDRRIEKVLKQLVMIKEYKKYYVANGKMIDAPSGKQTDAAERTGPAV